MTYKPAGAIGPNGATVLAKVRLLRRFRGQVGAQTVAVWDAHYCTLEPHRGQCCDSCQQEYLDGYHGGGVMVDGWCCCYDERMGR